jgi:hypothetical protein
MALATLDAVSSIFRKVAKLEAEPEAKTTKKRSRKKAAAAEETDEADAVAEE